MLPPEILPAIARQKVKNKNGQIGEVVIIETVNGTDYLEVLVKDEKTGEKYFESFALKDCEPVPEEPRPFRVNDAVVMHYEGVANFSRISSIVVGLDGTKMASFADQPGAAFNVDRLRFATPEEQKEFFN